MTRTKEEKELIDHIKRMRSSGRMDFRSLYLITALIRAVRAEERERCAKVAEGFILGPEACMTADINRGYDFACNSIAAAIREGE